MAREAGALMDLGKRLARIPILVLVLALITGAVAGGFLLRLVTWLF